jgi:hypothetical protein
MGSHPLLNPHNGYLKEFIDPFLKFETLDKDIISHSDNRVNIVNMLQKNPFFRTEASATKCTCNRTGFNAYPGVLRSLAYGRKPRSTWKPGLAVCVSAGLGETQTAEYLAGVLRAYGAFAVGKFTAMATGPGEFVGRDAVKARTKDLASDLARAIREKRRRPASDMDLRFYQFMGDLVKNYKDTVMKHDDKHWQTHSLFDGFEKYIQQTTHKPPYNPKARDARIKELIAQHKKKRNYKKIGDPPQPTDRGPQAAKNCAELLQMMPLGFNGAESDGLEAIYQFEISGEENFTACLKISGDQCSYHDGPSDNPGVIIKTPADVLLAISKGELDGQQAFMSGK